MSRSSRAAVEQSVNCGCTARRELRRVVKWRFSNHLHGGERKGGVRPVVFRIDMRLHLLLIPIVVGVAFGCQAPSGRRKLPPLVLCVVRECVYTRDWSCGETVVFNDGQFVYTGGSRRDKRGVIPKVLRVSLEESIAHDTVWKMTNGITNYGFFPENHLVSAPLVIYQLYFDHAWAP